MISHMNSMMKGDKDILLEDKVLLCIWVLVTVDIYDIVGVCGGESAAVFVHGA